MSFFDEDVPKKPSKGQGEVKERRRGRNRKQAKKQEVKVQQKEKPIYPPLMIRAHVDDDELEQPLEDYVNQLYDNKDKEGTRDGRLIQSFIEEDDEGNIQYKLKLVGPTEDRLDHLATQMKYRIKEGFGQAYYRIGVEDNGRPIGLCKEEMLESLRTICILAGRLGVDVMTLRVTEGLKGLVVELIIRQKHRQGVKLEIRVLLLGQSGSGKSTLLGVLKSGEKDNGKGHAREKVFTHKHEFMTGATQSRSHHVIGFDAQGKPYSQQSLMSMQKWLDNSNKLLTFIDVGGHRKAQKQLVSSLCSFFPEYALWVVSGLQESPSSTDTLELASIFRLPLIVVVTHLDKMTLEQQMQSVLRIKEQLKKFCPDKTPCIVREMEHAVLFSRITSSQDVLPIFLISSVTGRNLNLLTSFLNLLTSASELKNNEDLSTQFSVSDKYAVEGKLVLAGTVIKGSVKKGQMLHLGPDLKGSFRTVEVQSIECLRVPVKLAKCGQICTLAIRPLNYAKEWLQKEPNAIRRGMVLVDSKSNPRAVYQFLVELTPYSNQREQIKVTEKYQPVINSLTTRQICNIVIIKEAKEKDIELPDLLQKKKSRSIDSRKTQNHLYQSQGSLHHNQSGLTKPHKFPHSLSKKSIDLGTELRQESQNGLQPIAEESKGKKWRQPEQIRFVSGEGTLLRLRFKYYPEYITVGQKVIINELKLVGRVKEIFY